MESSAGVSLPKSVTVDGFTVHKLMLSEYAQVFDKLQKLPEVVAGLSLESPNDIIVAIPKLVSTALPEIIEILAVATRQPTEKINSDMSPQTAIRCMKAMLEVNDFLGLWEEISQILPKGQKSGGKKT